MSENDLNELLLTHSDLKEKLNTLRRERITQEQELFRSIADIEKRIILDTINSFSSKADPDPIKVHFKGNYTIAPRDGYLTVYCRGGCAGIHFAHMKKNGDMSKSKAGELLRLRYNSYRKQHYYQSVLCEDIYVKDAPAELHKYFDIISDGSDKTDAETG